MELVILVGLVSSVAAGFACAKEHEYAERHAWRRLERYATGALTWLVGVAPAMATAVYVQLITTPVAVLLYGMCWLIIGGMGIATWLCYQPPVAMPEVDPLEEKINRVLGEK